MQIKTVTNLIIIISMADIQVIRLTKKRHRSSCYWAKMLNVVATSKCVSDSKFVVLRFFFHLKNVSYFQPFELATCTNK